MQKFNSPTTRKFVDFFEVFLSSEKFLFDRRIQGFAYYHFIRFHFFDLLIDAKKWIQKTNQRQITGKREKLNIANSLIRNSVCRNWRKDEQQSDILILNSAKKVRKENRYIDPYTHCLTGHLSRSFTIWEDPVRWRHLPHDGSPNLFYLDSLHIEAAVQKLTPNYFRRDIRQEAAFLSRFTGNMGLTVPVQKIASLIQNAVFLNAYCAKTIENRLRRKKVKLLILVTHYVPMKMLIVSIARSLGIYVIELQHGNMGRYHIAYNFAHTNTLTTLPDEIFTFGKFWSNNTRISANGVILTATGMPWFNRQSKLKKAARNKKTRILFLSQEVIGQQLGRLALDLTKRLNMNQYEIVYKLHPNEYGSWRRTYGSALHDAGIQVVTKTDLYALLNSTDIHVGVYSTTVMESLIFEKMLILYESYGIHYFTDLIRSGRASLAKNSKDLAALVKQYKKPPRTDVHFFWESDSIDRMTKRIDRILN